MTGQLPAIVQPVALIATTDTYMLLRAFVDAASRRGQAFWRRRAEPVGFGGPGSAAG